MNSARVAIRKSTYKQKHAVPAVRTVRTGEDWAMQEVLIIMTHHKRSSNSWAVARDRMAHSRT